MTGSDLVAALIVTALAILALCDRRKSSDSERTATVIALTGFFVQGSSTGGWRLKVEFEDEDEPRWAVLCVNKAVYDKSMVGDRWKLTSNGWFAAPRD